MPVVRVTHSNRATSDNLLGALRDNLQAIVAAALNVQGVEGAQLVPDDVELEFVHASPYNVGKDLHILVLANWFEERAKNLTQRSDKIAIAMASLVGDNICGFVYVRLTEAGFSEF